MTTFTGMLRRDSRGRSKSNYSAAGEGYRWCERHRQRYPLTRNGGICPVCMPPRRPGNR